MTKEDKKYRFLIIPPFRLPPDARFGQDRTGPKENRLQNYEQIKHYEINARYGLGIIGIHSIGGR